jgi:uncharacterized membrane protein
MSSIKRAIQELGALCMLAIFISLAPFFIVGAIVMGIFALWNWSMYEFFYGTFVHRKLSDLLDWIFG